MKMISRHGSSVRRVLTVAIALGGGLGAMSCGTAPPGSPAEPHTVSSPPMSQPIARHWIQDQRLRTLMAELSKQNPSWPAGLPQEPESPAATTQPAQFEEIAGLANALADAADHLPDVAAHIPMGQADRAGFLAEARTLHEQAVELQAAANRRRIELMQRQMDGINSTCVSCHSRYRDFSGQLNRTQASIGFFE